MKNIKVLITCVTLSMGSFIYAQEAQKEILLEETPAVELGVKMEEAPVEAKVIETKKVLESSDVKEVKEEKERTVKKSVEISSITPQKKEELADLDIKSILNLTPDQKKEFFKIEQQYNDLRLQLGSEGEERYQIENQINKLEHRQISNILTNEQMVVFNNARELQKKAITQNLEQQFSNKELVKN